MATQIQLGEIVLDVLKKDIKNVHLSVHPPTGKVRISAPLRMSLDAIRLFAISKVGWIRKHRQKIIEQERETPREYLDREGHHVWGRRYLLQIVEHDAPPLVEIRHNALLLRIRPGTDAAAREAIVAAWYRQLMRSALPPLIDTWQARLGVTLSRLFIRQMKTRWGSCNPRTRTIRLNTELAKKPAECLEYILVHELIHLLEPSHGPRFVALMDQHLPKWQFYRATLNRLPVRHEHWVC